MTEAVCRRKLHFLRKAYPLKRFFWLVRDAYRYEGVAVIPWKLAVESISPWGFLRLVSFYEKDLTRPLKEPTARCDVTACQARSKDVEKLALLIYEKSGQEEDAAFMKLRIQTKILDLLRRGHTCFIGKIGEQVVHYNWVFFHWNDSLLGRYVHLRKDEALLNDAYTSEPWRGRAIHTFVQYHMLLHLQNEGYRRAYTFAFTDNRSSLKTHHRLGWQCTGLMLYFVPHNGDWTKYWRLWGSLEPFMREGIPMDRTNKGIDSG